MTIDELAVVLQREYEGIRSEMADLKATTASTLRVVDRIGEQLVRHALRWDTEFESLTGTVQGIEQRVNLLERSTDTD